MSDHYIDRMELAERDVFLSICDAVKKYNISYLDVLSIILNIGGDVAKLTNGKLALQIRGKQNG
jgi:hypothetical protein